ncbi:hypothetical protein Cgig2_034051 [Carnegiea gigantea]|uniref:Ribosomal protein S7 n=1 Tax=Carnegiea gigantea TaxID=171969 RepID=A0A9Q1KL76_9CARY|nr:hypothetical protein Cgig2_034051 [Carnegiea gigantea]
MLVNHIPKHGKKTLAYKIICRALKKIQQKKETNPLSILRQQIHKVTPYAVVKARCIRGSTRQNENFFLDSARIFVKAFHLLLFDGSFIFLECILIFGLILLLIIYSSPNRTNIPWLYFISLTSLIMSITAMLFQWRDNLLWGNVLCTANNFITIFLALECFILCSYVLSRYTKKDVWSNKATMKYLLIGGASSSILAHRFSWLYGIGFKLSLAYLINGLLTYTKECSLLEEFRLRNPLFDSASPTLVIAFLTIALKVDTSASATLILNIHFLISHQTNDIL